MLSFEGFFVVLVVRLCSIWMVVDVLRLLDRVIMMFLVGVLFVLIGLGYLVKRFLVFFSLCMEKLIGLW